MKFKSIYYSGDVHFTKDVQDEVEQSILKREFEFCCEDLCKYFDDYIDVWNEEFNGSEDEYQEYINKLFTNLVNNYNQDYSSEMRIVICVENGNCVYAYPKKDKENKMFYNGWFYQLDETKNVIEHENEEQGENKKLLRSVIISTIGAVLLPTPGQIISTIACLKDYMKSKGD